MILSDRSIKGGVALRPLWLSWVLAYVLAAGAQAATLTAHALQLPPTDATSVGGAQLSPNGRWLAYVAERKPGRLALVTYDLTSAHAQAVDLGPLQPRSFFGDVLAWRPDSRACAVGVPNGWAVVTLGRQRVRWIDPVANYGPFESCAAWSPHGGRLAVFSGGGYFRVWDGTRLRRKADWAKASGAPSYATERAWQCEWSPNEKALLLRFYGQAERNSDAVGHMMVVDPDTGRDKFDWGAEAEPAHWLDDSHVAFRSLDESYGSLPATLQVARPSAHRERTWRASVVDWALTDRRDAVWIVTGEGDVWRTAPSRPRWRRVGHSEAARRHIQQVGPVGLSLSPDGNQAVLVIGSAVELISSEGWPVGQWREAGSDINVLGWAAGRNLPLLAVGGANGGPYRVCQMVEQQ